MILIAEVGSTKSNWVLLSDHEEKRYSGLGFNPKYQDKNEILAIFKNVQKSFFVISGINILF